jgi:ankyrin repeat protein
MIAADSSLTALWLLRSHKMQPLLVAVKHKLWDVCLLILDSCPALPTPVVIAALHRAAAAGQEQVVARLLVACDEPLQDVLKSSGLHGWQRVSLMRTLSTAASSGHHPVCQLLVQAVPQLLGEHPSIKPILKAAACGHVEEVCLLLDAFADSISQQNPEDLEALLQMQRAALVAAAKQGHVQLIRALVARGVNVNTGDSTFNMWGPLAHAIQHDKLEAAHLLLDNGAGVLAGTGHFPTSALSYAVSHRKTEACRQLLSRQNVVVGRLELCAAVDRTSLTLLALLLESEGKMNPELRQDQEKRAECLGAAVAEAVGNCMPVNNRHTPGADSVVGVLQKLLDPPAHWGPVTPAVLAEGVRAAKWALSRCETETPEILQAIEVLAGAGADLGVDEGALLRAAAKQWRTEVIRTIVRISPHVATAYGKAVLHDHCHPSVAMPLIEAGMPVHKEQAMYEKLLVAAIEHQCDALLDLLSS